MIELPVPPKRTFAEFFAGVGLMRIGLERKRWQTAFANDICK
jgi:site-specific DNA-cytosine methylase